ncbi:MAG TPA: condensation domain-containing protein [Streptosporangiaceae bacterium]|jgi:hypothetical protein|nr:condensation domain-containing protein [Streptosporangiaceae bacterium]
MSGDQTVSFPPGAGHTAGPLSPTQLGMWMHSQFDRSASLYLEPHCFVLPQGTDPRRLADALARAVTAYPAFTGTTERGADEVTFVLGRHDICLRTLNVPPDRDGVRRREAIDRELAEPFVLDGGPLMRCVLLRDGVHLDVLLIAWHHIVIDGRSMRLFLDDLARAYEDVSYCPAPPPVTVCDANAWRQDRAHAPETAARITELAASLADVPLIQPRWPAAGPARAEITPVRLGPALTGQLYAASRKTGLLPYSFVCTAYQHALARSLNVDEFLLGCVVAGRTRPEFQRVAGFFSNTELVRSAVGAEPADLSTVRAVQAELARAHEQQKDIPVSMLAARLREGRQDGLKQVTQVILSVGEDYSLTIGGQPCEEYELTLPRAIFVANLVLRANRHDLHGFFEHKLSVLTTDEAAAFVSAFTGTLAVLTAPAD